MATTVNEAIADRLIGHSVGLERVAKGTAKKALKELRALDRKIVGQLETAGPLSRTRLEKLLRSIRRTIGESYNDVTNILQLDIEKLTEYETDFQDDVLRKAVPIKYETVVPSPEQVVAAVTSQPFEGRLLSEVYAELPEATFREVRKTIRQGVIEGATTPQIIRTLRGTRAAKYRDGVLAKPKRQIEAVVRTALNHTSNTAREITYEANADLIKNVQWVSTLDGRTTLQCFPGSTSVVPLGELGAVFRRFYDGDMIIITTASGKEVRATPNHPILTARGWRKADEISPVHDVLWRAVGKSGRVGFAEDVNMPATFAELSDAVRQIPGVDVSVKRSSHADFHGDGQVGDCNIYRHKTASDLRFGIEHSASESVKDNLLASVHISRGFTSDCRSFLDLVTRAFGDEAAQIEVVPFGNSVKATFTDASLADNLGRLDARPEHCNHSGLIGSFEAIAALEGRHDAGTLERSCDSSCGGVEPPSDFGGADAFSVEPDNVVSVRREFFSGHVYNLQTSLGMYIADGFIVHNCASLDGNVYEPGKGPRPPAHFNCRSTTIPITKSWKELGFDESEVPAGTRASMNGQVPAGKNYDAWLRDQPLEFQDEVLGKQKADIFRSGVPLSKFVDDSGRSYSIDELRAREGIKKPPPKPRKPAKTGGTPAEQLIALAEEQKAEIEDLRKQRDAAFAKLEDNPTIENADAVDVLGKKYVRKMNEATAERYASLHGPWAKTNETIFSRSGKSLEAGNARRAPIFREAAAHIRALIHPDIRPQVNAKTISRQTREYYLPSNNTVHLSTRSRMPVYVHEATHALEFKHPWILEKTSDFLMKRANGEKLVLYQREAGYADKWVERGGNQYSGRDYSRDIFGVNKRYATEILTMGIERIIENPLDFAQKDPEYFNFLMRIFRNE